MGKISGEITIDAPPEVVFDFLADERNEPRFNPHMLRTELISNGPLGVGTKFRAVVRSMGRPVEMVVDVVGYDRPMRLESVTHLPSADVRGVLTFVPAGSGTRMRWSWDLEPRGLLKLLSPILARLGRGQEAEIWRDLKRHLETRPSTPSSVRAEPTIRYTPISSRQPVASRMSA